MTFSWNLKVDKTAKLTDCTTWARGSFMLFFLYCLQYFNTLIYFSNTYWMCAMLWGFKTELEDKKQQPFRARCNMDSQNHHTEAGGLQAWRNPHKCHFFQKIVFSCICLHGCIYAHVCAGALRRPEESGGIHLWGAVLSVRLVTADTVAAVIWPTQSPKGLWELGTIITKNCCRKGVLGN